MLQRERSWAQFDVAITNIITRTMKKMPAICALKIVEVIHDWELSRYLQRNV
jgi:hypothetical protein